jgi:hypothetical protein
MKLLSLVEIARLRSEQDAASHRRILNARTAGTQRCAWTDRHAVQLRESLDYIDRAERWGA